jgi:tetratricopeptide (TPR) repeat protein
MKLSLSMIVRGGSSAEELERSLKSIVPFVEEVCIVETYVTGQFGSSALENVADEVCKDFDVPMAWQVWEDEDGNTEHEWISDFSKARNMAQEMVTGDLWCYIDSDTALVHGDLWRADIDKHFANPDIGVMQVNYHYDEDDATGDLNREVKTKMVFRSGVTEWRGPVHELSEVVSGQHYLLDGVSASYYLKHFKDRDGHDEAVRRNFWIIESHMKRGGEMDGRLWLSLAMCQVGLGEKGAALAGIQQCLTKSPCDNDRWRALSMMGGIVGEMGHYDEALSAYGELAALHPQRSSPWVYIAQTMCDAGRWEEALAAIGRAGQYQGVDEGPSTNPLFVKYSPLYSEARAYAGLGEWGRAISAFEALLLIMPGMKVAREHMEALKEQVRVAELYASYKAVAENAPEVWGLAPPELDILPEIARAKMPKRPKGRLPVMIWCGPPASGPWGPRDLESGMGGSEEAVVYLSRELALQGCHVEVYASPSGEAGTDNHGVVWVNHSGWEDRPGIFIQWRGTHMIAKATKADARYVWLHDVQNSMLPYTDALKAQVDGVFCLTDFHAEPLMDHGWSDKVIMTKNGLPPGVLEMPASTRVRNSFAYYSSPDRGLDRLLDVWRDIRYAVPEATLDIFYGFTPYYLKAMGRHPHLKALKVKIEAQVEGLRGCGVTWRGMVGQDELHLSMAETDCWLYPTAWPETSCITGMKCQALGCIPITSRYAESGVPETVKYDLGPPPRSGSIYDDFEWLQEWVETVVSAGRTRGGELPLDREEMVSWAKKEYSWTKVAKQWSGLFSQALAESQPKAKRKRSPAKAS